MVFRSNLCTNPMGYAPQKSNNGNKREEQQEVRLSPRQYSNGDACVESAFVYNLNRGLITKGNSESSFDDYCLQMSSVVKCVQIKWEMPKKVEVQQQRKQKRAIIRGPLFTPHECMRVWESTVPLSL